MLNAPVLAVNHHAEDHELRGCGVVLVPTKPTPVELIGDAREPVVHDVGSSTQDRGVVDVGSVNSSATVHRGCAMSVEGDRVRGLSGHLHDVGECFVTHPERPRPAHGHALKGCPDELVGISRSFLTNKLVVDRRDAHLRCGEAGQVDGEPRREALVHELVETVAKVDRPREELEVG